MPDILSMIQNFNQSLPGLYHMVTGLSVLGGFWFFLRGLYQLRQYGELRTMMSVQTELKKPLLYLFTGAGLIFWPTIFHIMMTTVFSYENPLQYSSGGLSANYDTVMQVAGRVIQLIGFIGFIRGWFLLTAYAEQGMHQNPVSKALTHIIGGILAINIFGTWDILKNTFGIGG